MTQRLFLDEPTLASTSATVISSAPDGIVLDRTVFYARGGGSRATPVRFAGTAATQRSPRR